ncbi:MAG TPA: hypothetical protein VFP32_00130 [Candidatus Saccharimonadales bacterium]|nr:hypothetical protein [Candidatus Saccharimonadales bacterium]
MRELYHTQVGFIQIEVPEGTGESKAEVRFLEQDWEPYQASAVGISREGFVASLADERMAGQFAAIVLHDQILKLMEQPSEEQHNGRIR